MMRSFASRLLTLLATCAGCVVWTLPALAQIEVHEADTSLTLEARWQWATEQLPGDSSAYIAWRFTTVLDEKLHINAMAAFEHGIGWQRGLSVNALIAGNRRPQEIHLRSRELVMLMKFSNRQLLEIDLLDSTDPIRWQQRLYWLGDGESVASYQLLAGLLDPDAERSVNRSLINAIGVHTVNERNGFLNALLNTSQWASYRPVILHALAQQHSGETETLLLESAASDNTELTERLVAITALRSYSSLDSLQVLLSLTDARYPQRLRREAIESLAWFPAEQVSEHLNQIAWFDDNHRVRNEAVKSLAKLQSGNANTLLLTIARQHPSAATREEAMDTLRHQLF